MPPPPKDLKRKTLTERAGETNRPAPAPPSSRPINAAVRATSISGAQRQTSFSSSISSSRPPSVTSMRNVSNSSFASSLGPGSRPSSAQTHRPQTSMAKSRIKKPMPTPSRASTALDIHPDTERALGVKRKGRTPFSSTLRQHPEEVMQPRTNGNYRPQLGCSSGWTSKPDPTRAFRDVSLSTAFSDLKLSPTPQATPKVAAEGSYTPSHIPRCVPSVMLVSNAQSPSKSPQRPPKPLPQFLNRESNTSIAWDTNGRLEDVEQMYSDVKEKIYDATTEINGLKEMISVYQSRSKSA